jgi:hypothetical protein
MIVIIFIVILAFPIILVRAHFKRIKILRKLRGIVDSFKWGDMTYLEAREKMVKLKNQLPLLQRGEAQDLINLIRE